MIQSTPMVHPTGSRVRPLPLAFELSPIIYQECLKVKDNELLGRIKETIIPKAEGRTSTSLDSNNLSASSEINFSTWIGGDVSFCILITLMF